jgi:hypothetical protein
VTNINLIFDFPTTDVHSYFLFLYSLFFYSMLNDSLDTEMLQQFIASDASAPVIAPVVASASLERLPSPSGTLTAVSPVSLVATASVLEVDGGGGEDATQGEFQRIDSSTAAASGVRGIQGSRTSRPPMLLSALVKMEYALSYLADANDVCGAQIGSKANAPFCLKLAGTCEVTSHRGKHPGCVGGCLYIKYTSEKNEVALDPVKQCYVLRPAEFYDESEYAILDRMNVLHEWNLGLGECKKKEAAFRVFAEFSASADIVHEEMVEEAREDALRYAEVQEEVDFANGDDEEEENHYSDSDSEEARSEASDTSVVAGTKTAAFKSGQWGRSGREARNLIQKDDESDLSFGTRGVLSNDRFKQLMMRVETLETRSSSVLKLVDEQAKEINGLEYLVSEAQQVIRDTQRECQRSSMRKAAVLGYERDVAQLKSKEAQTTNALASVSHDLARATEQLKVMELALANGAGQVGGGAMERQEITDLGAKVKGVEGQIYLIKNRLGADLVKFGNVDLKSLADTYVWVQTTMPGDEMTYGCFYDLVALLDSLMDSDTDLDVYLKTGADSSKSLFHTTGEARTSSSFNRAAPAIFSNKTKGTAGVHGGTVDRLFGAVKERTLWTRNGGSQGMKALVNRELGAQFTNVSQSIVHRLGHGEAAQVAQEFLTQSRKCYNEFVNWSESFYLEIMDLSSVKADEAWSLVLECWGAFFESLRAVRGVATGQLSLRSANKDKDRAEKVSLFIYTMGRAIHIQNEFVAASFKKHPAIATVINYHLFGNRVPQSIYDVHTSAMSEHIAAYNIWKGQVIRELATMKKK